MKRAASERPKAGEASRRWLRAPGLAAKLLLLTIAFVMLAEVLIFLPSVSNFRLNYLNERLMAAQIAALAVEAAPGGAVPELLSKEMLDVAMVHAVALKRNAMHELVLQTKVPAKVDAHYDLRTASWPQLIADALYVFIAPRGRLIYVVGKPDFGGGEAIEIIMSEVALRKAMVGFALKILGLSILISVMTASLVYLSLHALLVRPMTRLTRNMIRFRENPEDVSRIMQPCGRTDEIGIAERELATMQGDLTTMLRQKNRLAALGLAVSKINHDLRNMLASAQLISDRLGLIPDPTVQRFAPKLIAALDRAIRFCTETLAFGRVEEMPPHREAFTLAPLVDDIADTLDLKSECSVRWRTEIPPDLKIDADRGQLRRVLSNLIRNAREALEAAPRADAAITVRAFKSASATVIEVIDNGPGIPAKAREHLFQPFQSSMRKNGTGLGLTIAAEIVRAHGGRIMLLGGEDRSAVDGDTPEESAGTVFCIEIPDRVPERMSA